MSGRPADAAARAAAIGESDPRLRAAPGNTTGRWRDPVQIARDQVTESRAARAAAERATTTETPAEAAEAAVPDPSSQSG